MEVSKEFLVSLTVAVAVAVTVFFVVAWKQQEVLATHNIHRVGGPPPFWPLYLAVGGSIMFVCASIVFRELV